MPSLTTKAALHLHHIDMGLPPEMRSYEYPQAMALRAELIAAGIPQAEVDSNGIPEFKHYYGDVSPEVQAQLANSPAELITAVSSHLEDNPEDVLMVTTDGQDAVVISGDFEGAILFRPDGRIERLVPERS